LVEFTGVQSSDVGRVWPFVEGMIAEAFAREGRGVTAEDVKEHLERAGWQLWVAHDQNAVHALCLTEILNYPRSKTCRLVVATGHDREDWVDNLKVIEAWAAANGCDLMETWARPGWRRVLKDYRWTHVLLEKKLCPPQSPRP
jgi:hypothetical protein